jgi:hypothetical protein
MVVSVDSVFPGEFLFRGIFSLSEQKAQAGIIGEIKPQRGDSSAVETLAAERPAIAGHFAQRAFNQRLPGSVPIQNH